MLPIPTTLVAIATYLVGAAVLMVAWLVCVLCGVEVVSMKPGWLLLMLPVTLVIQFAMILGIGLFLANLYVFVRDIRQIWGIVTMVWMFLSPVFWVPEMVVQKLGQQTADMLFACNPAFSLIQAQRMVLGATDAMVEGAQHLQFGDFWTHIAVSSTWAAVFMVVGFSSFVSRKHKYADLV